MAASLLSLFDDSETAAVERIPNVVVHNSKTAVSSNLSISTSDVMLMVENDFRW